MDAPASRASRSSPTSTTTASRTSSSPTSTTIIASTRTSANAKFEDVTARSNLGGKGLVGGPATAFDYDKDGLLDLYIGYFGDYIHGELPTFARRNTNALPDKLFHNKGNFVFEDVTAGSGVDNPGWAQAVGHLDFDGDGWEDLICGNDFGANSWYRNLGGTGKFEDVSSKLGTDKPSYTMNIGIADLNRDGYPDVYISNIVTMNKDEKYVLPDAKTRLKLNPQKMANMRVVEANDLWTSTTREREARLVRTIDGRRPRIQVDRLVVGRRLLRFRQRRRRRSLSRQRHERVRGLLERQSVLHRRRGRAAADHRAGGGEGSAGVLRQSQRDVDRRLGAERRRSARQRARRRAVRLRRRRRSRHDGQQLQLSGRALSQQRRKGTATTGSRSVSPAIRRKA